MTRIQILGAGTPTPSPDRFGTALIAEVEDDYILFDCGPATTYKLVKAGIAPTQIDYLFFTHHHFDHDSDYPCFLLTRWHTKSAQTPQLTVYGPEGTETMTERLLDEDYGAFNRDWKALMNASADQHTETGSKARPTVEPPSVSVEDIEPGFVHDNPGWQVRAAQANHHQPWLNPLAYRLDTDDKSIVFTGDTGPCQSVTDLAQGADLLVCMCWNHQEKLDKTDSAEDQLGTTQAAVLAEQAGVSKLVLTHLSPRFARSGSLEKGIADVESEYDGEVIVAEEFMEISS
jgi:ribonuclease Z